MLTLDIKNAFNSSRCGQIMRALNNTATSPYLMETIYIPIRIMEKRSAGFRGSPTDIGTWSTAEHNLQWGTSPTIAGWMYNCEFRGRHCYSYGC